MIIIDRCVGSGLDLNSADRWISRNKIYGFKYLHRKISTMYYCVPVVLSNTFAAILRYDTGKVRDRCGGMGRFKGRLRCEGRVNGVITNVIT